MVERVNQIQPEFQILLLRYVEAAQKVGVKLVLAVAAQPVERVWEDAGVERIRLEVCRSYILVSAALVVPRAADIAHLLDDRFRHDPTNARLIR